MNSLNDIWDEVKKIMGKRLTPTAMNTWFADCQAVALEGNTFVIASSKVKKGIIEQRYTHIVKEALSDLFSCDFDLLVIADTEVSDYLSESTDEDSMLPQMAGYTFDRFIVGASNKYAHAAAMAVADNPGSVYNPLFIYGNSGLGKTHLLLSIGHVINERNPKAKIVYIKGDDFMNDMVGALKKGTIDDFRMKYRNADLFLVDDIQFIAGKDATQNEFFHTFNNIYEAGNQIVITSDRPPIEMSLLDDRLRTRFEGGLMADIAPPDLETRMAIIRNKAAQLGLILSDDAVEYIATRITQNVRQLEGVIKRLTAFKDILNDVITIDSVKRAINDIVRDGETLPTPQKIILETARYYSLTENDLRGPSRSQNISRARQIAMYLIRSLLNYPLESIGKEFGDRTHSTVISSIAKIEKDMLEDSNTSATVRDISSNINSK